MSPLRGVYDAQISSTELLAEHLSVIHSELNAINAELAALHLMTRALLTHLAKDDLGLQAALDAAADELPDG